MLWHDAAAHFRGFTGTGPREAAAGGRDVIIQLSASARWFTIANEKPLRGLRLRGVRLSALPWRAAQDPDLREDSADKIRIQEAEPASDVLGHDNLADVFAREVRLELHGASRQCELPTWDGVSLRRGPSRRLEL